MSYIYKGEEGWIKQPDQTVSTFMSGLCLIQQSYLIRKDKFEIGTFAIGDRLPNSDTTMCVDGAFIFPAPQYSDAGNGFMKCSISAYGRVNTNGSSTTSKRLADYVTNVITVINNVSSQYQQTSQKIFDARTYQFVILKNERPTIPYQKLLIYDLNGSPLPESSTNAVMFGIFNTSTSYTLGVRLDRYETTDYGVFEEVTITNVALGSASRQQTLINP